MKAAGENYKWTLNDHTVQLEGTMLLNKPLMKGKWQVYRLPAGLFVSSDFNRFTIIRSMKMLEMFWMGSSMGLDRFHRVRSKVLDSFSIWIDCVDYDWVRT